MEMKIPKELKNLKTQIEARKKELGREYKPPRWEHYLVWYGSNYKIPSHLWMEWKEEKVLESIEGAHREDDKKILLN